MSLVQSAGTNAQAASRLAGRRREEMVDLLSRMLLIRAFDSILPELYTRNLSRGSSHAALGQEAVAVGACAALEPQDYITSTHRGHGHAIAKGADVDRMMAELLGRATGYCRGKGGSMHIADFSVGMLGANGIVGGGFGLAAGAALSTLILEEQRVTVCFFGDGAINQGLFHETANLASVWCLPLVLLCENNQFAMSARVSSVTAVSDLSRRADAYGMPGQSVDGMDVLAVKDAVAAAASLAREGGGPSLLVADCYRFAGHFSGDTMLYRSHAEAEEWLVRDPVERFEALLLGAGTITRAEADELGQVAKAAIAAALEFAKASPYPDPGELWEDFLD